MFEQNKSRHAVKRGGFSTSYLIRIACAPAFTGFSYGHCGKKFAPKVPGEVLQVPAPGADSETFV